MAKREISSVNLDALLSVMRKHLPTSEEPDSVSLTKWDLLLPKQWEPRYSLLLPSQR